MPGQRVHAWAADFVESGYDTKALLKQMVLSDPFNASHTTTENGADTVNGIKRVTPEQGSRMIRALTGFEWRADMGREDRRPYGQVDLMTDARFGYRVLAGGIDGWTVVVPSFSVSCPTVHARESFE